MQLEENSNLDKLSLYIHFSEEYHYTLHLIRLFHMFNLRLKNSKYGLQFIYMYEEEKIKKKKTPNDFRH